MVVSAYVDQRLPPCRMGWRRSSDRPMPRGGSRRHLCVRPRVPHRCSIHAPSLAGEPHARPCWRSHAASVGPSTRTLVRGLFADRLPCCVPPVNGDSAGSAKCANRRTPARAAPAWFRAFRRSAANYSPPRTLRRGRKLLRGSSCVLRCVASINSHASLSGLLPRPARAHPPQGKTPLTSRTQQIHRSKLRARLLPATARRGTGVPTPSPAPAPAACSRSSARGSPPAALLPPRKARALTCCDLHAYTAD